MKLNTFLCSVCSLSPLLLAQPLHAQASTYNNPVDGAQYTADWESYQSEKKTNPKPVEVVTVKLLSTDMVLKKNTTAEEIAAFTIAVERNVQETLGTPTESFEMLLNILLSHNEDPQFGIAVTGDVADSTLTKVVDNLASLPKIYTKEEPVKFQLHFKINKQTNNKK